jgi:hypothetical protein
VQFRWKGVQNRGVFATVATFSTVVLSYLTVQLLPTVSSTPIPIPYPGTAVPMAGALLLGPIAGAGAAVGRLLGYSLGVRSGHVGAVFFESVGYLLFGYVVTSCWTPTLSVADGRTRRTYARLAFSAIAGCAVLAATSAWGYEILGWSPFFVSGPSLLVAHLGGAVVLGFPLFALLHLGIRDSDLGQSLRSQGGQRPVSVTSVLPLLWLGVGYAVSAGYQVAELVPAETFGKYHVELLLPVRNLLTFGTDGAYAQAVLGSFVVTSLVLCIGRSGLGGGGRADG